MPRPSWDYGQMSTYEEPARSGRAISPPEHSATVWPGGPRHLSQTASRADVRPAGPWHMARALGSAQQMPWQQYGHQRTAPDLGQTAGFYGQQPVGGMMMRVRARPVIVGSIEQPIPAQQFSNELNPNDVLVNAPSAGRSSWSILGLTRKTRISPQPGSWIMVSGHVVFLNGRPVLSRGAHEIGSGCLTGRFWGSRGGRFRRPACGRRFGRSGSVRVLSRGAGRAKCVAVSLREHTGEATTWKSPDLR